MINIKDGERPLIYISAFFHIYLYPNMDKDGNKKENISCIYQFSINNIFPGKIFFEFFKNMGGSGKSKLI